MVDETMAASPLARLQEKRPFISCATDRKFVEPTATMLTSLDLNGDVPDAVVMLAGFDLDDRDRNVLRTAAGRLGDALRFLEISREQLSRFDTGGYTEVYPLPVLGRLFVADHIDTPDARLITVDSDMIINSSLRPLLTMDFGTRFFAAVHDTPRAYDPSYLNSGLTVADVAAYRAADVAGRCLRWLADQTDHPHFPDQDALNHILGGEWVRLDSSWNHFCYAPLHFEPADWEAARVTHFAGPKPWNQPGHGGERLYYRYNAELHNRLRRAGIVPPFRRSPRIDAVAAYAADGRDRAMRIPAVLGCACDPTTVEAASATIASFDRNGDAPEAAVLVAAIDLSARDRARLIAAAGRRQVRFLDVTDDALRRLRGSESSGADDQVALGRLMLADAIDLPVARLMVIEPGLIVNGPVAAILYRDFGANFLAAVADRRDAQGRYGFRTDMLVIDVDGYRYHQVAERAARWMADRPEVAERADQEALNDVVGVQWVRLAQTWNYWLVPRLEPTTEDYELCRIAREPPLALVDRYRAIVDGRLAAAAGSPPRDRTGAV